MMELTNYCEQSKIMLRKRLSPWSMKALSFSGYIGSFEIDYTTHKIRANGKVGPRFFILKKRMLDGVSLDLLDPAYHPYDRENIHRMRAGFTGRGGRYKNCFRVKDPFHSSFSEIEASLTVQTDHFGIPVSAAGAFFEVSDLMHINDGSISNVVQLKLITSRLLETEGSP